jgi:hypothetical protein
MGLIGPESVEPATANGPAPKPGNLAATGPSGWTLLLHGRKRLWPKLLAARVAIVPALLLALARTPLEGQTCPDGAIARVLIVNHSIFDPEDLATATRFRWAYGLANSLHVRTREGFIRSELLFREGECYDPRLLAESERLLRNYRFIARAEITAQEQPGGWTVLVATQDEWTTRVSVQGTMSGGPQVERVGVTEQNLLGAGVLVGGSMRSLADGDDAAARVELPRLLGTRTDAALRWARDRDGGHLLRQSLSYPFLGEVGRLAASQSYLRREGWFEYASGARSGAPSGEAASVYLPLDEELLEITVAGRLGRPGNLTILGVGFSNHTLEFSAFEDRLEIGASDGTERGPADSATAEAVRAQTLHSAGTHVNLMIAQRNVRFQEFRGLDALRGTRDVPIGVHVSLLLGRRIGTLSGGGQPDDLLGSLRAEWSVAAGPLLAITAGGVEGRRIFAGAPAGERWKDVLSELAAILYWQPPALPRHTFFLRAAGVGGWSLSLPFQLSLGGAAGVRGYTEDDFPGGRRIVLNAEDRIYVGWPHPELFDLGVTLLADAGRIWPGDAPFGTDPGWRGTIGAGLRVGFPAGSGRVGRLDVAWPVSSAGIERTPQLRLSIGDPIGLSARLQDRQLARTRVDLGPDRFTEHLR